MPDTTAPPQQMDDLTQAIARLLPAINRLEQTLRSMDKEALARQQQMAEALDRIAAALEALPKQQESLMTALSEQTRTAVTLATTMRSLDQPLKVEAEKRAELTSTMAAMKRLLEGPA
jgi:ABC-type transporter Mla subunit MlaD